MKKPPISFVLSRLDVPMGRHGRTICPIHHGDSRQAFSFNDETSLWYCFRCGAGGDVVKLVMMALGLDFRGALRWLGIEPGTFGDDETPETRAEEKVPGWPINNPKQPTG